MNHKNQEQLLHTLEGLHTIETIATTLNITKQSALNLITKLKRQQYVTVSGKGKTKRLYKITQLKQRPRVPGMFDIINKYSPHMKLNPWYDHQVHGTYGPEEALIDAIETQSFRVILASLHLFRHIKNWPKVYQLAKQKDSWQKIGALYDLTKLYFKVRHLPQKYKPLHAKKKLYIIKEYQTTEKKFQPITQKWHVNIPFRLGDIQKTIGG